MKSYKKVRLHDISEKIGSGMTPLRTNTEYWNSKDIPWVKTELLGQYIISETSEYISQKAFDENSLTLFPANTLSIAMYGEGKTRGNVSIFGIPMTSNQACCNLIIDEQQADYKYVYYALKSNYDNLRNLASGVRNNLNSDLIKNFEIPLPDLPTQKKIADVLSCIDDKIALNNKTNTELENMATTIYDYWFTQFDFPDKNGNPYKTSGGQMVYNEIFKREIPTGWEVRTIESISKRVKVGFVGPIDEYYCDNDSGYPIIRPAEMSEQGINYDELRHITKEFYDKNLKSQVHKGDILLSRCGKDGIPNIYESDKEAQVLNAVIIEPKREIISEYFTFDAMRSQFIQDQISNGTSGSVQGVINTKIIAAVILPFDETVAKKYVEEVSPIHQKISKCREESRKLIALRDYLLPLLMNGQIEVK
ncbi:MAG: restriction endonuclease subunit S [Treponema sp.]|nr:restriction endonuclease subunit S [Treponema sp.]